jgi:hypothetical protein
MSGAWAGDWGFVAGAGVGVGRKRFFFEKKKQKTFIFLGRVLGTTPRQRTKVFWFFFSKKNILTSFILVLGA